MKLRKKNVLALFLAGVLSGASVMPVVALTDDFVFNDQVQAIYSGREEAIPMIENLKFTDVGATHWAKEAIVRDGALNLVKGFERKFSPQGYVSKQEALAFILRVMGLETQAVDLGNALAQSNPQSTQGLWGLGYLNLAMQQGMITPADYADATAPEGTPISEGGFDRNAQATREEIANWLYIGMNRLNVNILRPAEPMQEIFRFNDWKNIDADKTVAVEAVVKTGFMKGDGGNFRPKNSMTRAEMAQVIANVDSVYYTLMSITKRTGTVAAISDNQYQTTGKADLWRNVYVRTDDGTMVVLQLERAENSSPQAINKDVVVLRNGQVSGLESLQEGDQLEFLVQQDAKLVLYVFVTAQKTEKQIQAKLHNIDTNAYTIGVQDENGKNFSYSVIEGILQTKNQKLALLMDDKWQPVEQLPYGAQVKLTLINDLVVAVSYVGQNTLVGEFKGIVIENQPDFGFITIVNNKGERITMQYDEGDMQVEKQQHTDTQDEVGYFNQIFPYFGYDERTTTIRSIEPGDIVFIRPRNSDPNFVESISAATNYIMRYGKVKTIVDHEGYKTITIEYENKQTTWFDVANDIFVTKDGKLLKTSDIQVGDWAKFLLNEAMIEPGFVLESVKEITLEGAEHFISTLIKGNLAGINPIQNKLSLSYSQTLSKSGWVNYKDLESLSIASKDVEYFYEDKQISLDYAVKYFKHSDTQVYVALENKFSGETVRKVTFRTERDLLLNPDTVIYADGSGAFSMLTNAGGVVTDEGTIVRRHGRLVQGTDIMAADYLTVVQSGQNKAAIVDITDSPDVSQIMIARGRVATVKDNVSFRVQSISQLSGTNWFYSPVQREYGIDAKTLFLNQDGYVDPKTFLSYTDTSVVDKVYNIVTDGAMASYVVDSPFANMAVRGTIYAIEGETVLLKDAYVLDDNTKQWKTVSSKNPTMKMKLQKNTIIGKNNQVVQPNQLVVGDQLRILTNAVPSPIESGIEVVGYIVMVEK